MPPPIRRLRAENTMMVGPQTARFRGASQSRTEPTRIAAPETNPIEIRTGGANRANFGMWTPRRPFTRTISPAAQENTIAPTGLLVRCGDVSRSTTPS